MVADILARILDWKRQEAARRRADLIVLGTHERSGVSHALIGSVAEFVVTEATCDVAITRPMRYSFELP
jgi:nucleotide-binding universal stress UspA family protein